jgi:hypothetical protein
MISSSTPSFRCNATLIRHGHEYDRYNRRRLLQKQTFPSGIVPIDCRQACFRDFITVEIASRLPMNSAEHGEARSCRAASRALYKRLHELDDVRPQSPPPFLLATPGVRSPRKIWRELSQWREGFWIAIADNQFFAAGWIGWRSVAPDAIDAVQACWICALVGSDSAEGGAVHVGPRVANRGGGPRSVASREQVVRTARCASSWQATPRPRLRSPP